MVDRALARLAQLDDAGRAEQLAAEMEAMAASDPAGAAQLAHELGERCERRLGDDERAAAAYRRAIELDPALRPARWALRRVFQRRAQWPELVKLIDAELARAPADRERVELLVERAIALGHQGDADDQARIALTAAVQVAPRHQPALLELERVAARAGDAAALLDVWERLAGTSELPERKIVYWLALARHACARDHDRADEALDAAAELAEATPGAAWSYPLAERVARERLRLAEAHGAPAQVEAAVGALVQMLADHPNRASGWRRELVALHRRRAQLVQGERPAEAWDHLQRALALFPEEPVVLVDLIELAGAVGRYGDLPGLIHTWQAVESDAARARMLSLWCAEAHLGGERREPARALLRSLEATAPGFAPLTSIAECDALADVSRVRTHLDLAHTYLAAADAATQGTWLGPAAPPRPDPGAAAALYVQAAQLLAFQVATPAALDLARDALGKALDAAPDHPAVVEAWIELDDTTDRAQQALLRLHELAAAPARGEGDARAVVERALRVALGHDLHHAVVELQHDLVRLAPDDLALAWRLEAALPQRGRDDERAALLDRLARDDRDPARRRAALLRAARLHERAGDPGAAIDCYRALLATNPGDAAGDGRDARDARDALIDLLRAEQRWTELASERRAEAQALDDPPAVRRALREAAWVLEVCAGDLAQAAAVHDDWLARLPDDRTALEGLARCCAALGEHDRAAAARARIAALDPSPEARWLHARSLERAGRHAEAAEPYRSLLADPDPSVAAASAALALGELAARGADLALGLEAAGALAGWTDDPRLGAALHDAAGWMYLTALDDTARAAQSLAAARAIDPARPSALLGAALVAARRSEPDAQAEAYVELAAVAQPPELAAALLLRAAALAIAGGDPELASQRVEAARVAAPEAAWLLVVAAETEPPPLVDTGDPFAAVDRLLERAELFDRRAGLADPAARTAWQLDRAEALELAGQAGEACAILAAVLRAQPDELRAVAAVRRIAERAGDEQTWAQAIYALARRSRDPGSRLALLRDAAAVYDRAGPSGNSDHALAIYRRILAADPGAPELDRLCELLRERGGIRKLIGALTDRLSWLAAASSPNPGDDAHMIGLLLERSALLYSLGRHREATADLEAILDYSPQHTEALRLCGDLAMLAGEVDRAATLWWAYLEVETSEARRNEIELRLAQALGTGVAPPPVPRAAPAGDEPMFPVRSDDVTAVRKGDPLDPFSSTTVETDLSPLQQQELAAAARSRPGRAATETEPHVELAATIGPFDREETVTGPALRKKLWPPALELAALFRTAGHEAVADGADREPVLDAGAIRLPDDPQLSPDDSDVVMLSYEQFQPVRSDEAAVDMLLYCEREIAAAGEPVNLTALRIEAGRLCETLGDPDRARAHYEAAIAANPAAATALRGLRRIARAGGDAAEIVRLLDAELATAGAGERDALARYRIDVLIALGDHDRARAAAGELLGRAPLDPCALLAQLELAVLDERADELGRALEALARAVADPALGAALNSARAALATHRRDAAAAAWSAAEAEADAGSPAARLAAIQRAAAEDRRDAAAGYLELAYHLEAEDPVTAAALAVRAQLLAAAPAGGARPGEPGDADRETLADAAQLATRVAPRDSLVARIAAETALAAGERASASHAFARWARCAHAPVERAHAAARAAELEPTRLGRLWAQALEHDPGDDHATARLRAVHVAAGDTAQVIELDRRLARDTGRNPPLLRAAAELIADDQVDAAIDALTAARAQLPGSEALTEALADALAEAGRWVDRANLLGTLAADPGAPARDLARLRAALAWDRAARIVAGERDGSRDELRRVTLAALDAWDLVLDDDPRAAVAHAARLALAGRLGDPDVQIDVLARAQAAERSPWAASSLALRRAQLLAAGDPRLAEEVLRDAGPGIDDPRRTLAVMLAAARRRDLGDAATALEDRALQLESAAGTAPSLEPAALRLRAAQLALDADDPARARALLAGVDQALPGLVDDLIDAAARRAGVSHPPSLPRADSFTRGLRDAELAAARGRPAAALELYQRALDIRPTDPLAAAPVVRIATALRDPQPIAALALEQLRTAEAMADPAAKADAYELLARAEELRGDAAAAQIALEAAVQADPSRLDLLHRLERELAARRRHAELLRLRERQIDQLRRLGAPGGAAPDPEHPDGRARDLAALLVDAAVLAVRAGAPDPALAALYRAALDAVPHQPRAALQLAAILRRAGASEDLAALEEQLAAAAADPASKAAFLVAAGDTLALLGKPAEAVRRFARAHQALPRYLPALEAWQHTAVTGKLWRELAEAVSREASLGGEPRGVAALYHVAGVALMDKAQAAEPAIAALRRALELDPGHVDSFVRLRILYDHTGQGDELAALLRRRLDIEPDRAAQVELHRLLAEHGCAAGDREAAMQHYRAVLRLDPADVRAHAAIADLASDHAPWQDQVSAVMARIPLERDPGTLRTLHHRLGVLYADHDPASALGAFQRAVSYRAGDKDSLTRLTDLAMAAGKWQLALDTCNELVTTERDPDKLASHLHRAAAIFDRGFSDRARAERMLELAFDSAPTSADGLRLLVKFYQGAGDPAALRAQLNRIAGAMRARIAQDPGDGAAYRTLSRAIAVRAEHIVDSSLRIARAAAELAQLLGAAGEPEQRLIAARAAVDPSPLLGPRSDELMFSQSVQPELRHIFRLVAQPLARHLGVDLAVHGVGKKDRLPPGDPVAAIARDVAASVGLKDVDVYVSSRDRHAMLAEPTSPVSIVLGHAIATDEVSVRFAAAAVLKLSQMSLAIPARLPVHELGVLGHALLRLFRPELMSPEFPLDEVNAQMPGLRRLIPPALFEEVKPYVRAVVRFSPEGFARDLRIAGLRAGLAASGSLLPGLTLLAASTGADPRTILGDPIAQGLIGFALSDARATTAP